MISNFSTYAASASLLDVFVSESLHLALITDCRDYFVIVISVYVVSWYEIFVCLRLVSVYINAVSKTLLFFIFF